MTANVNQPPPSYRKIFIAFGFIWLAVFLIAETGIPNLVDNERRIGAYVLDAIQNGHWFVQRDAMNEVASKPPLLTWIAALITLMCGKLTEFAMHFPSALATLGASWLLLWYGWKRFGWLAGFLAALMYLLSPMADKQVFTARYDGLFALPVTWAAFAAFEAWTGRGKWITFWLACAIATMVKGPLGVLLGAVGLLAAVWEWRSGNPLRPRGNHLPGIILYFAICGGWFALAYLQMGEPLIDKMIGKELVGHSLSSDDGNGKPGGFWEPACNVFSYFLPWSFISIVALWRVVRRPSTDLDTRRLERFLFCWFAVGLVMFSISPHQRGRLIFPLVPALALLTGRELAHWLAAVPTKKILGGATVFTVVVLSFLTVYHHVLLRKAQQNMDTLAMHSMAEELRTTVGEQFPITYVDAPFSLPFYLNIYRPWVTAEVGADLLRGEATAFVAVRDPADFENSVESNAPPVKFYSLMSRSIKDKRNVTIISNHPRLEWTPHMVAIIAPFYLHLENIKLVRARGDEFIFERQPGSESWASFSNLTEVAENVRVRYSGDDATNVLQHVVNPHTAWQP